MAYTNAQLVRREAGDAGQFIRELKSGDGTTTAFWLEAPPVMADTQLITVGGAARTEVAATPGATEYTFNDTTGAIVFGAAPTAGVDNVVITYWAVKVSDDAITEALRQFSLLPGDTAATAEPVTILSAARMVCEWMAAETAGDYDFSSDGQDYKRSTVSAAWAKRATMLTERLVELGAGPSALISIPVTRLDGYSRKGEYSTRDHGQVSQQNPRRQFYGETDRLP